MFDTSAIKSGFSRAATAYDEFAILQRRVREMCLTLAHHHWKKDAHILDAGCGTAALTEESPWRVTNLDLAFGMCQVAGTHSRRVVNANATSMPFATASFDGIFSSLMLQWVNAPREAFAEMARVVKPGGKMIISTLVAGTLSELKDAFKAVDDKEHVSAFMETHALLEQAKEAGCALLLAKQSAVTEYYPDAILLMRALQAIGATHKQSERRRGLMTPQQFARMENAYNKYRTPQGLLATWQVVSLVLQKA